MFIGGENGRCHLCTFCNLSKRDFFTHIANTKTIFPPTFTNLLLNTLQFHKKNKIEYSSCMEELGYQRKSRLCWINTEISWEIGWGMEGSHLSLTLGSVLSMHTHCSTKKRPQVRPSSSIFEECEPWTEPHLNLRRPWVCCAVIFWNSSRWWDL